MAQPKKPSDVVKYRDSFWNNKLIRLTNAIYSIKRYGTSTFLEPIISTASYAELLCMSNIQLRNVSVSSTLKYSNTVYLAQSSKKFFFFKNRSVNVFLRNIINFRKCKISILYWFFKAYKYIQQVCYYSVITGLKENNTNITKSFYNHD